MSTQYLLGVDLGTSSCKATLLDRAGRTFSASSKEYGFDSPRPGWAEQSPAGWGVAALEAVDAVAAQAQLKSGDRVTVGYTGQMHSSVLLDERNVPVRSSILWSDSRAQDQCAEIERAVPGVAVITGNAPLPAFTLPQILWVRENQPAVFARVAKVLVPKDYLRMLGTGITGTDWTDASAMGILDSETRAWSPEITAGIALDPQLLPDVHNPAESAGRVEGLLPRDIDVRASFGVGDQFAEALAAGVIESGEMSITLGTSAVILGVVDHPVDGAFCHAPDDRWLRLNSLHAGGMNLTWFRDRFAPGFSVAQLVDEAATAPPGADGLFYLPFLVGERDARHSSTRGGFVGVQFGHSRAHFVRAILEGVAFELRRLSWRKGSDTIAGGLAIKGGGAKSALWRGIIEAVFNSPSRTSNRDAAYGAALTAGISAGWWADYGEAVDRGTLSTGPKSSLVALYEQRYGDYCDTVLALRGDIRRTHEGDAS